MEHPDRSIEVLVLGGGLDRERAVSLQSAAAIAAGLSAAGMVVHALTIDELTPEALASMPGDVIWPALHGPVGEGGPVQDMLAASGRPFVGAGPSAARRAMDKLTSKIEAARVGLATAPACILRPDDPAPPLPFPLVIKPVAEGSTIGLFICRSEDDWPAARAAALASERICMVESFVRGREITVPFVVGEEGIREEESGRSGALMVLPAIEIVPAEGLYDYDAKYERKDTRYDLATEVPDPARDTALAPAITRSIKLCRNIGIRHLARADFILDNAGVPWFLEINTMPGFTDHSLLPMAARGIGLDMPALCARIVRAALADGPMNSESAHASR